MGHDLKKTKDVEFPDDDVVNFDTEIIDVDASDSEVLKQQGIVSLPVEQKTVQSDREKQKQEQSQEAEYPMEQKSEPEPIHPVEEKSELSYQEKLQQEWQTEISHRSQQESQQGKLQKQEQAEISHQSEQKTEDPHQEKLQRKQQVETSDLHEQKMQQEKQESLEQVVTSYRSEQKTEEYHEKNTQQDQEAETYHRSQQKIEEYAHEKDQQEQIVATDDPYEQKIEESDPEKQQQKEQAVINYRSEQRIESYQEKQQEEKDKQSKTKYLSEQKMDELDQEKQQQDQQTETSHPSEQNTGQCDQEKQQPEQQVETDRPSNNKFQQADEEKKLQQHAYQKQEQQLQQDIEIDISTVVASRKIGKEQQELAKVDVISHAPKFYDHSIDIKNKNLDICKVCHKNQPTNTIAHCTFCKKAHHFRCAGITKRQASIFVCSECQEDQPCQICKDKGEGKSMLLCDACDKGYHNFCIGLEGIPDGDWYCEDCIKRTKQFSLGFSILLKKHKEKCGKVARPTPRKRKSITTRETKKKRRRRISDSDSRHDLDYRKEESHLKDAHDVKASTYFVRAILPKVKVATPGPPPSSRGTAGLPQTVLGTGGLLPSGLGTGGLLPSGLGTGCLLPSGLGTGGLPQAGRGTGGLLPSGLGTPGLASSSLPTSSLPQVGLPTTPAFFYASDELKLQMETNKVHDHQAVVLRWDVVFVNLRESGRLKKVVTCPSCLKIVECDHCVDLLKKKIALRSASAPQISTPDALYSKPAVAKPPPPTPIFSIPLSFGTTTTSSHPNRPQPSTKDGGISNPPTSNEVNSKPQNLSIELESGPLRKPGEVFQFVGINWWIIQLSPNFSFKKFFFAKMKNQAYLKDKVRAYYALVKDDNNTNPLYEMRALAFHVKLLPDKEQVEAWWKSNSNFFPRKPISHVADLPSVKDLISTLRPFLQDVEKT